MKLSDMYEDKLNTFSTKNGMYDNILVQLEVTNACNHSCYFCPHADSIRPIKMMDINFAKRIIKECADFLGRNKRICFHMNGEPLLYNNLRELVDYSKNNGYEYVFLTTNGSLATDDILRDLFDAGLDSIKFSINGGSRESYKKIHGRDDFDKAMHALKFSFDYRKTSHKHYKIFVSCVGTIDNYGELEKMRFECEKYCDEVVFYYPCGYAGNNNNLAEKLRCDLSRLDIKSFDIKHSIPCAVLWNSINVTCEGFLALCCSESDNRLIVEDLSKKSVKEAWLGNIMSQIRKQHLNKEITNMPCFSCVMGAEYKEEDMDRELFKLSLEERVKDRELKDR